MAARQGGGPRHESAQSVPDHPGAIEEDDAEADQAAQAIPTHRPSGGRNAKARLSHPDKAQEDSPSPAALTSRVSVDFRPANAIFSGFTTRRITVI